MEHNQINRELKLLLIVPSKALVAGQFFSLVEPCIMFLLSAIYCGLLYGLYVPDWQFSVSQSTGSTIYELTAVKCSVRGDLRPAYLTVSPFMSYISLSQECNGFNSDTVSESMPSWCHAAFDPEGIVRFGEGPDHKGLLYAALPCIFARDLKSIPRLELEFTTAAAAIGNLKSTVATAVAASSRLLLLLRRAACLVARQALVAFLPPLVVQNTESTRPSESTLTGFNHRQPTSDLPGGVPLVGSPTALVPFAIDAKDSIALLPLLTEFQKLNLLAGEVDCLVGKLSESSGTWMGDVELKRQDPQKNERVTGLPCTHRHMGESHQQIRLLPGV
ncbi:hypothetical protein MTR67_045029 [Solanum verrucosum]|uniref:Uncharacterized protein n=1 Tax=Solanum verrucosum TaxID=315347 RepID=A0AAF0UUI6_SOLVR|nr:hypothetical protein MTR67_045029 [Solanum verrucosum]